MSENKLELDDDITTRYDIKKRIGKGVSAFNDYYN